VLRRFGLRILLAVGVSVLAFAGPPEIIAASSQPPLPTRAQACVVAGQLRASSDCVNSLAQAEATWPGAAIALNATTTGNGSWIVPDPDGLHFDMVLVSISTTANSGPVAFGAPSASQRTTGFFRVDDVLALVVVSSGSGHLNTSGHSCGNYIGWSGKVWYQTWYLTHLEMDVTGYFYFCQSAFTTNLTPVVYGAGSWTYSSGTIGNGTTKTNPWINWYGSNITGCCSDTLLERFYMDAWGNWNWAVWN